MFHSEIGDSAARFSIGTGSISSPDKFYILEASSPEKKQEWTKIIKDLLNQQFEMLKGFLFVLLNLISISYIINLALKQPNQRPRNFAQESVSE